MLPFPDLVQRYYPLLTRYARRIIHNERAAEELLPSVFNQLHISLPELRNKKQIQSFLCRATRIACNVWLHKQVTLLGSVNTPTAHNISSLKNQSPHDNA